MAAAMLAAAGVGALAVPGGGDQDRDTRRRLFELRDFVVSLRWS